MTDQPVAFPPGLELATGKPAAGETAIIPLPSTIGPEGTSEASDHPQRSYGCTFGCGNPYDYVFVSVADGTTEFLCLPCFLKLAEEILDAVVSPDGERVMAALQFAKANPQDTVKGPKGKRRGKNAPAASEDDDLVEAFDSVITVDELPEEFK